MNIATAYAYRGIIRHLNGDYCEFNKLAAKATKAHNDLEYERKAIGKIGEIIPTDIKQRLYIIAGGVN